MPLNDDFPQMIGYLLPEGGDIPGGTAFVVSYEEEGQTFRYLVTARHCTWGPRRVRLAGVATDQRIDKWYRHPTEDVAVARFNDPPGDWRQFPLAYHAKRAGERGPRLGDRVYFGGFFNAPQTQRALHGETPLIRSGTLGAWGIDVELRDRRPDGTDQTMVAHGHYLVDVRSYAGFSGSPCVIQADEWRPVFDPNGTPVGIAHGENTLFLGIVIAHIRTPDSEGVVGNSGVAVVLPHHFIEETLMLDELKGLRAEDRRKTAAQPKTEAVLDSAFDATFTREDFIADLTKASQSLAPKDEAFS